jgi:hypothetical protein
MSTGAFGRPVWSAINGSALVGPAASTSRDGISLSAKADAESGSGAGNSAAAASPDNANPAVCTRAGASMAIAPSPDRSARDRSRQWPLTRSGHPSSDRLLSMSARPGEWSKSNSAANADPMDPVTDEGSLLTEVGTRPASIDPAVIAGNRSP